MSSKNNIAAVLALMSPVVAITAHAEIYMSDEQATKIFFPTDVFKKETLTLTDEDAKKIESASGENVRNKTMTIFKSKDGNIVFIDQALGKHEFITYAIGINKEGKVQGIEILEYRESYGHQVRREEWRKQFVGKDKTAPLKLDKDIKNLSGATLSSAHITGGVRRILQTYEQVKGRL
ncbi:MAG TPA: FMN-binding protein [Bdellovibrio sp.]|uniref:FMN-binding protein n=1 Tax=Bdellovibrio sp. TaxID=28201 RepID=UPI002EFA18C5